jgi:hypothetical protein
MEGNCPPHVFATCFSSGARRAWECGVVPVPITGSDAQLLQATKYALPILNELPCNAIPISNTETVTGNGTTQQAPQAFTKLNQQGSGLVNSLNSANSTNATTPRTSTHPPKLSFVGVITPFSTTISARLFRGSHMVGFEWEQIDGNLTTNTPCLKLNQAIVNLPESTKIYPLIIQVNGVYQHGFIEVLQGSPTCPISFYLSLDRKVYPTDTYVVIPSSGIVWAV